MKRSNKRSPHCIAPVLGFALLAGLSVAGCGQDSHAQAPYQQTAPADVAPPSEASQSAIASPVGIVPGVTDEALVREDPDFAWRATWSEAPYWGGRIGYVDAAGVLCVNMRYAPPESKGSGWVVVAKDVADFQLMDWRIAVRKKDGTLWFGDGPLNEPLRTLDEHVAAYQMTLIDIRMLSTEGAFRYSEGGPARTVATGVRAFQVQHTGRMGVLGNDGDLWLFEGGRPQGEAFRKVASNVKFFQLEREWVSYLEEGSRARLMVAKSERVWGDPWRFAPVASGVEDFESEISVEMGNNFSSRLHLAAVGKGGSLLFGEAAEPTQLTLAPVGTNARELHWAGAQLAVLDQGGNLRIAPLSKENQLQAFRDVGHADGFRLTQERTLLVARNPNEVSLVPPHLVEEPALAGAQKLDKAGAPLGKSLRVEGLDLKSEQLLRDGDDEEGADVTYFEISSIRPSFQRRAMTAPEVLEGKSAALSFPK